MRRLLGKLRNDSSDGGTAEDLEPNSVGPHVLYDGTGDDTIGVDIVFVHGLRGSAHRTWSKGDICWPRDLLKKDIPNARVITWGYDSDVSRFFNYASKESIFGHADTLLGDLARLRQDIIRPIVFVAHSLGGLVVKAALIKSDGYEKHNRHASQANIYASTCGVAFFGTPHRGSPKEGYGEILAGIAKLGMRQPNKSLLETLKKDSHILEGQRDAWTTISNDITVICIREELPTAIGMIVPEASASYDGFNVQRSSINANHSDMVKFDHKEDPMYQRAAGLLVDLAKKSLAADKATVHMAQLRVLSFDEYQDRELKVDDAYNSTCQWVTSHDTILAETDALRFETWINSSHNGLFISGKAASGKSTLMKYLKNSQTALIQESQWASDPSSVILATFFFHERGSNLQKSREGMLRSLIYQILSQVPMRLFDTNTNLNWHNLTSILHSAIESLESRGKKLFLFLDGLDEFRLIEKICDYTEEQKDLIWDGGDSDAAWGVSTWISDGHREISTFILELCSKENVKICFSCRELSVFEARFRGLPRLQLHRYTRNDIYRYSHGRLSMEVPGLHDVDNFASAITDKASGVFLWVKLVVNMLINGYDAGDNTKELRHTLELLPDRLGGQNGLYMSMLRHIRQSHRAESAILFKLIEHYENGPWHLLQLLFTAESLVGTQKNGFGSCIQIDEMGHPGFSALCEAQLRRLKSRCGGLLEADPFVSYMHQTAKEFMQRQFARRTVFGSEPEFTEVNLSSAYLEGYIALFRVIERLPPSDTPDLLWQEPKKFFVSIRDVVVPIEVLDHSCIDTQGYVCMVDRMNGIEVPQQPLFSYDEKLMLDPKFLKNLPRGPWFVSTSTTRSSRGYPFRERKPTKDFMSFAARTNLSKYINFKLEIQTPSQRVKEARRLWKSEFPFGATLRWAMMGESDGDTHQTSESDIGINTCRTLLPHIVQSDNNGSTKAMEILLPTWARALDMGCYWFIIGNNNDYRGETYEVREDWLELILLMLQSGVPVNTPVRLSAERLGMAVTLSSSEVLLGILQFSKVGPVCHTTCMDFEVQELLESSEAGLVCNAKFDDLKALGILERLPKDLTCLPFFKFLKEMGERGRNWQHIRSAEISVKLCSDV